MDALNELCFVPSLKIQYTIIYSRFNFGFEKRKVLLQHNLLKVSQHTEFINISVLKGVFLS